MQLQITIYFWSTFGNIIPANTQRSKNIVTTSLQRRDVAATLCVCWVNGVFYLICGTSQWNTFKTTVMKQNKGRNGDLKPEHKKTTNALAFLQGRTVLWPVWLTFVLLNPDIPCFANSVDPDQLASEEANWSGSALFAIKYANLL